MVLARVKVAVRRKEAKCVRRSGPGRKSEIVELEKSILWRGCPGFVFLPEPSGGFCRL